MTSEPFDPVAMFRELEQAHVSYVVIGTLAGVLRGTGEITSELVICPRMDDRNLEWLAGVLERLGAATTGSDSLRLAATDEAPRRFATPHGGIAVEPYPPGSKGWEDLRRRAERMPVDNALRVNVAASEDLLRLLTSGGVERDRDTLARYQKVVALERSLDLGIGL